MIRIGITENVYVADVKVDDKNALLVSFDEIGKEDKPKVDNFFDNLSSDEVIEIERGTTIRVFPPLPPKADNGRTEEKNVELLVSDLNKTKGIALHILKVFYTADDLRGQINMFESLPIDKDNFNQQIVKKEILEGAHKNICKAFARLMAPHIGPNTPVRLLLVRQSVDKHYATFRNRYLDEQPFIESMEIPKEASKLKFSSYELEKGLDNDTPVKKPEGSTAAGVAGGAPTPAPLDAANVFGT